MNDYANKPLNKLADDIVADGIVDAGEVKQIRERLYADGVIDREEADFLFRINDAVSGNDNDPSWTDLFVEAISSHVLEDETSPGVVDEEEAKYLIGKITGDEKVDATELALLVNIAATASGTTEGLQSFILSSLKSAILEDGIIDSDEVDMLRTVVYGKGSGAGAGVDRAEADLLFELNDACSGKENSPRWKEFFVEAVSRHVLEDETSPGEIDDDEAAWLVAQIEGDGQVDDAEKALLTAIKAKASKISDVLGAKMEAWGI